MPASTQTSKLNSKHVALTNPKRDSSLRAAKKASVNAEKQKRKTAKIKGFKTRGLLPKQHRTSGASLKWTTALGLHKLWIGYVSELLDLQLVSVNEEQDLESGVKMDPAIQAGYGPGVVMGWQGKLTKADYHGAIISGVSLSSSYKTSPVLTSACSH